jgi:hypothetical protein
MLSRKMFRVSRSRNPLDKNSRSLDRLLETRFALLDTQEFCEKREISMQTFTRILATRNLDASIHENSRSAILRVKFFAYVNNLQLYWWKSSVVCNVKRNAAGRNLYYKNYIVIGLLAFNLKSYNCIPTWAIQEQSYYNSFADNIRIYCLYKCYNNFIGHTYTYMASFTNKKW